MAMTSWMAWEGGVDLMGTTASGLTTPNLIVHLARMVHTPHGSAPAGLVLWQPDSTRPPEIAAFVCTDAKVGAYFSAHVFKDTPFEKAPALHARISVTPSLPKSVTSRTEVAGRVFEIELSDLGPLEVINRAAGPMPFAQQGLEAAAKKAVVSIDGKPVRVTIPALSMSGGPGAVWSPCGIYAR